MIVLTTALDAASTGPSWAQVIGGIGIGTAVGSIVSALITGGFLRSQSKRQDAREDLRLKAEKAQRDVDRETETTRRREERQYAHDHWREKRHMAHVNAMSLMDSIVKDYTRAALIGEEPGFGASVRKRAVALAHAVSDVGLLAGNDAARAARGAWEKVNTLGALHGLAEVCR